MRPCFFRKINKKVGTPRFTMVFLRKQIRENKTYYHLEHSYRDLGEVKKKRIYLGTKIPYNLDELKEQLLKDVYKEQFYPRLKKIKQNYFRPNVGFSEMGARNRDYAVAKVIANSQFIEGTELTMKEMRLILHGSNTLIMHRQWHEMEAIKDYQKTFYKILNSNRDFSVRDLIEWHSKIFNTKAGYGGKLRDTPLKKWGKEFSFKPREIKRELEKFVSWFGRQTGRFKENKKHPVELAALVHFKFCKIHPFPDMLLSRLLPNFVLDKNDYPLFVFKFAERKYYDTAMKRAIKTENSYIFIRWFIKKYIKDNQKRYY